MFAHKIAKIQAKVTESSTGTLQPKRSKLMARPIRTAAAEPARLTENESRGDTARKADPEGLTGRSATPSASWDFSKIPLFPSVRADRPQRSSQPAVAPPSGAIQAKLVVGDVNDPLEHEADRIADRVMRMPDATLSIAAAPPQISRKCATCEEEEKKTLQTKLAGTARPVDAAPPIVHEVLRSSGQPLDQAIRAFFEPRFGRSFDGVRIHTDATAAASAHALNAIAYTVGSHIAFAERRYEPQTAEGSRLLAHELTHTLQQSASAPSAAPYVQRTAATCPPDWKTTVNDDHDHALTMLDTAITKLSSYDGTKPPEVKAALDKHFKANGT